LCVHLGCRFPLDSITLGEHNINARLIAGTVANEGSIFVPMTPLIIPGTSLPLKDGMQAVVLHAVWDPLIGEDAVNDSLDDMLNVYVGERAKRSLRASKASEP